MPTNPTKRFEYWECIGHCRRQITPKQIRDSMNRAKAIIEQELPEINIVVLLSSINIQSNEFIGSDRRSMKRKALTTKTIDYLHQKFTSLLCDDLKVRCRRLSDLYPR